jgi:hypothetical protein
MSSVRQFTASSPNLEKMLKLDEEIMNFDFMFDFLGKFIQDKYKLINCLHFVSAV